MKSLFALFAAATLALVPASVSSAQTTLLSDTFADGDRTTIDLPNSTEWIANNPANVSTTTAGIKANINPGSANSVAARFVASSPLSLGVGDSLTLSFDFTVKNAVDSGTTATATFANGFRLGLFASNGAEADNGTGITNLAWNPVTGYFAALNVGYVSGSTAPIVLAERASTGLASSFLQLNHVTGGSAQPYYTQLGSHGGVNNSFDQTGATTYQAEFSLTRSATSTMDISLSVTGGALSGYSHFASDTTSPYTSFDFVAIGAASNAMEFFTIDNVSVSAIPEPSTYALLGGLGALGLACWRRRRSSAGALPAESGR